MKLSDGEKLIILMLADLHNKLEVDGEIEAAFIKSAILNDQLWGIRWQYQGVPFENDGNPSIVNEVCDILDMWSAIERSYSSLSDEERSRLEKDATPFGTDVHFRGFDGNNEAEHMGVAQFLIDDLGRFHEFKGRDMNSHARSIDTYRRMYAVLEPMRASPAYDGKLSVSQMIELMKARVHPSMR